MKNKFYNLIVILFFTSVNFSLQAQEITTLEQAVEFALESSPIMETRMLEAEKMSFLGDASYKVPKTDIGASYGQMNTTTVDQNYSISQSFNPFVSKASKELGNQTSKKADNLIAQSANDIRYEIRTLWNELEFHKAKFQLIDEEIKIAEAHSKFANRQFELGEINKIEKITAELDLKKLSQEKVEIAIHLNSIELKLQQWLGQATFTTDQFTIEDGNGFLEAAKNSFTTLASQAIQQDIKIAKAQSKLQSAQRKPEFTIGYFLQSIEGNQDVDNQIIYYNRAPQFQGVNLGMSVPIFGKAYKASEKITESNIKIAESKANEIEFHTQNMMNETIGKLSGAYSNFEFYKNEGLPLATAIKEALQKQYDNGEIGFLQYEHDMSLFFEAKENYLHSIKEYNKHLYHLMYLNNK